MGPVLSQPINLYIIWYGKWETKNQPIIRDFITSLSSPTSSSKHPSVRDWWHTVTLYTDQTNSRITDTINLSNEFNDPTYSQGKSLTRLSMQHVIKNAVTPPNRGALPLDYTNGLYLVLTSRDVMVQDFCGGSVCGFHYFTFPSIVGATVPYAWVGDSGTQCPACARVPVRVGQEPGPQAAAGLRVRPAKRGRGDRRDDQRDRARAGGGGQRPAGERVVRRRGPHGACRNRRSV
ncbi:protein exordium-like 3 [Phtheirospermum japonicum]|uniref:Protein exordium-like 3 n=1 Tax=Phtheirospermum japonicum TaxID=374723 RepID=A0A830D9C3_9LAMI|nr:protein exordium-like 3 [Phtheirospermum japonicum]